MFNTLARRLCPLLLTILALTVPGCSSHDPAPETVSPEALATLSPSARILQEAESLPSPQRENRLLDAVPLLIHEGDFARAQQLLNDIADAELPVELRADVLLSRANLALKQKQYRRVLDMLTTDRSGLLVQMPSLGGGRQQQVSLLRASALEGLGDRVAAANERIFVGGELRGPQLQANNALIWDDLIRLPPESLQALAESTEERDLRGWLELVGLFKQLDADPLAQMDAWERWSRQNIGHPARKSPPPAIEALARMVAKRPQQVTVILPGSGPLAHYAGAIRQGILSAYFAAWGSATRRDDSPAVTFIEEGTPEEATAAYAQAVQDGADFIIGPFSKDTLKQLSLNRDTLPVPTLALNYAETGSPTPANLFQFGLSAEDDARDAARFLATRGHRRVGILFRSGDGGWGQRIQDAFTQAWESEGRQVVAREDYATASDMEAAIKSLLDVEASEQRAKALEDDLDLKLSWEPRPRNDMEAVFLVMTTDEALQAKPLFNFHYAQALPLAGGFYLNPALPGGTVLGELEGIEFSDIPWLLEPDAFARDFSAAWPDADPRMSRFHALGVDAWRLAERLVVLKDSPDARYPGVTGVLSLENSGRILRVPSWSKFSAPAVEAETRPETTEATEDAEPPAQSRR